MKNSDERNLDDKLFYFLIDLLILLAMALVLNEFYATAPHPITHFLLLLTYFALLLVSLLSLLFIIDQVLTQQAKERVANFSNQKNLSEEEEFQKLKFKIEVMETMIHTSIPESERDNMFTKLKELHEERDKTKESDIESLQIFLKSTAQTLEANIRGEIDSALKINNETTTKLTEDIKEAMKVIVEEVYETYLENHETMIKEIDELREEREKIRATDMADLKSFVETKLTSLRSDLLNDVVDVWDKEEIADEMLNEIREPIEEVKKDLKSLSEKSQEMFKDLKSLSEEVEESNQELVQEIQDLKSLSEKVDETNQELVQKMKDLRSVSEELDETNQELVKEMKHFKSSSEKVDESNKKLVKEIQDLKSLSEKVDENNQELVKEIQDLKSLREKVDENNQELVKEMKDLKSLSDENNQEMVKEMKDMMEKTFLVAQETFEEFENLRDRVVEGFEELSKESKAKEAAKNVAVKEAAKEAAEKVYMKTEEMVEEKIRQWEEDNDDYLASIPLLYSNRR